MTDPRFGPEPTEGSGGFTNFTGVIIDAYFVDGDYGCSLNWVIDLDTPELYPNVDNPTKLFVACGSGWSAADDGDGVAHKDATAGEDKPFNKKSEMGQLNLMFRAGEVGNFDAMLADLPAEFSFYRASSWKGLHFRFDERTWETQKKDEETDKWVPSTKTRRFPVEYLGKAGGSPVAAASNGSVEAFDVNSLGLPESTLGALVNIANEGGDNAAFVSKAITVEGVTGNAGLMAVLSDSAKLGALVGALRS